MTPATTGLGPDAGNARLRDSLREIATCARDALGLERGTPTVDGLGITVQVGGETVFGGCNPWTGDLDDLQYGVGDGPCLLAHRSGERVVSEAFGSGERRWPRFTPGAVGLGLREVVSSPLAVTAGVRGSLNLYSKTPGRLAALGPDAVDDLVDEIELSLGSPVLLAVAHANARWFRRAVRDQADIDVAVGRLIRRHRITRPEASALLRQIAREDGITDVAAAAIVIAQD